MPRKSIISMTEREVIPKCCYTYFFKRCSVLSQRLLTENAVFCQKVNCKEKEEKVENIYQM